MILWAVLVFFCIGTAIVFYIDEQAQVQGGPNRTQRNILLLVVVTSLFYALLYGFQAGE